MTFENWRKLAETIGLMALVGSLIFVGLQMRQDHQIALAVTARQKPNPIADSLLTRIRMDLHSR